MCSLVTESCVSLLPKSVHYCYQNLSTPDYRNLCTSRYRLHGGGAAYVAFRQFGAVMGCGVGLRGQSYAIPTMQGGVETIEPYVTEFIAFAKEHPELFFYVTRIGCGIAGFRDRDIAPLFADAIDLENVCLPETFIKALK